MKNPFKTDHLKTLWQKKWILIFLSILLVFLYKISHKPILQSNHSTVNTVSFNPLEEVKIITDTIVGEEGFFRVGQSTKKHWWLIDPQGNPFFYKGVTSVGDGRGIPPTISPVSSYTDIIKKKYNGDWSKLRTVIFKQLKSWNVNAIGAWSASDLWDQGMPYTIVLDFAKVGPKLPNRLIDVFSPLWLKSIDLQTKKLVLPRQNSQDLVGYFTDNELNWGDSMDSLENQEKFIPKSLLDSFFSDQISPTLLQVCLSLDEQQPAYKAAWELVLNTHSGSLEQLAKDWNIPLPSQQTLKQLTTEKKTIVSPAFLKDNQKFWQLFAQRYFEQSAEAIHRYDHHHLLLGCRFGSPPNSAVFSMVKRPWVDILSFNNYRYNLYERMDIYYQATKLPVILSEFSWGHSQFSKRKLADESIWKLSEPERMVRNGERSLAFALTHPALIGYTWYRWIDQPSYPPSNPTNMGLITLKDEPNPWHITLLTALNAKAEMIVTTDFGYPLRQE